MHLSGRQQGPWRITFESGTSLMALGTTTWTTVVRHDSGWQIMRGERDEQARIDAPDGDPVGVVRLGRGVTTDQLIDTLTRWVDANAERLGQPGLGG